MADPAGLSAAVLVVELCALGYSYPNVKYYTKKEVFAAFRVIKRGRNRTKTGIFWPNMAEEGGTGAKPARGTRGPRVVLAARSVIATYRRLGLSCCVAERRNPLERTGAMQPPAAGKPDLPAGQPN